MMEKLVGWGVAYLRDGKRLTAAVLALVNLLYPKVQAFAGAHGLALPALDPGSTEAAASWAAVAALNLWSKSTDGLRGTPAPTLQPAKP